MKTLYHYFYHNLFEVTSRWEQFKFDTGMSLLILGLILLGCSVSLLFKRKS